jgi:hypothetical protein
MSQEQEKNYPREQSYYKEMKERQGYQAKIDKPPGKLPTWGSSVKKPQISEKKPNN